jgi:putative ABC transport system permease protein
MLLLTYLRRELRHRLRQTIFIVAGLAVGIGLVLTVAATSSGVSAAQGKVLASLYGLGTDITVGKAPSSSSQQNPGKASAVNPGQAVDMLISGNQGTFNSSVAVQAAKLNGVTGASAELILQDFKAPATPVNAPVHFTPPTLINVDGVEPGHANVGTLGQARLASGRRLRAGDANANVAVIDAGYAKQNKLKLGSTITIAKTPFAVVGAVLQPSDAQQQVFIPITPRAVPGRPE